MAPARPTSLRNRALAYLAGREHSRAELARKLARPTAAAARAERSARADADLAAQAGSGVCAEADAVEEANADAGKGADAAAIETLLDELEARGLLSTARYVDSVLHRRAPRQGAARIRQELRAQGVPDLAMRDSLEALAETEEARARALWQRRYGTPAADAKEAARQMRFLMARGFTADVVQRVVRRPGADQDLDHEDLARDNDDGG